MKSVDASQRQQVPFTYTDASGLIDPTIAAKSGGTPTSDADAARAAVVAGKADLFIAYPADPSKQTIEVAGRDKGIAQPTDYAGIARSVPVSYTHLDVYKRQVQGLVAAAGVRITDHAVQQHPSPVQFTGPIAPQDHRDALSRMPDPAQRPQVVRVE